MGTSGQLQKLSLPWYSQAGQYYSDVASGDPGRLAQAVAPQINVANQAYTQAQNQISQLLPKGGARDYAMTQAAIGHAGDTSRIMTGGINEAVRQLAGIGGGGISLNLQGLGV